LGRALFIRVPSPAARMIDRQVLSGIGPLPETADRGESSLANSIEAIVLQ
jgi:hypothetical protein